jgi:hypothetical protein
MEEKKTTPWAKKKKKHKDQGQDGDDFKSAVKTKWPQLKTMKPFWSDDQLED